MGKELMIFISKVTGKIVRVTVYDRLMVEYETEHCLTVMVKTRNGTDTRDVFNKDYELIGEL